MQSEEIKKKLAEGELEFCPECDLFEPPDYCKIICCSNPFTGPSDLDIEAYLNMYKTSEVERH